MKQPELGKKIADLRLINGLTQLELAEKCGVNIRTIQRIEAGEVMPRQYTINLLNAALQYNLGNQAEDTNTDSPSLNQPLRIAIGGGIVFILNGIPVVFDLITKSLNPTLHILTTVIHIVSCIFFINGFYVLGRYYKNQLLAIGSVIMMVLLPAVNILYLFKNMFAVAGQLLIFILMSINMIIVGAGLLAEAFERKGYQSSLAYKIAGISTIIISALYLSMFPYLQYAGLVMSIPANLLLLYIIINERLTHKTASATTDTKFALI